MHFLWRTLAPNTKTCMQFAAGTRRLLGAIVLFALLFVPAVAHGQVVNDLVAQKLGPPNPATLQQQRLQQLLADTGLATHPVQPGALPTSPAGSSIALPDITQAIPTTSEPKKLSNSIQILLLLSLLTLAPSILLMTTCFTRIIIVMSLLRQALGAAQLPPNQILVGLSLFMTFLVMGPTWSRINKEAIQPYSNNEISQSEAFNRSVGALREYMIKQVTAAHNEDDVYLFHHYAHRDETEEPHTWEEIGTTELVPAYVLSELKVAFLMGFRIYLPFLIIDMVISSVLISIGMQLLPPVMVSLPFKLLLFVLVDGWHVVVGTLLASFN
ncbi:MAG TPA: flagellar type III secretion system pore protein FliP [Phycisphaerae bacterium]|nr:flagellar type III secretion system pore protein FliP [Phycisphaerae bacterium]